MAKGDSIKVYFLVGDKVEIAMVEANQNGRRVTDDRTKTDLTVQEVTRGGTVVREVWFPLSTVLAVDITRREE